MGLLELGLPFSFLMSIEQSFSERGGGLIQEARVNEENGACADQSVRMRWISYDIYCLML
jgi:hypothetical protein